MLVGAGLRRFASSVIAPALIVASVGVAALTSASTASAAFSCASGNDTYTVRSGDGWFLIADRAEVTVWTLLDANGAAMTDLLVPGDRLCLPEGANTAAACASSYRVRSGDSWYGIAARVDVAVTSLLRVNSAELSQVLFAGDTLCLPDGAAAPADTGAGNGSDSGASAAASTTASRAISDATYTVRPGDGWFIIADRVQVGAGDLLRVNDATATDTIVPGQQLHLPAGAVIPEVPDPNEPAWIDLEAKPTQGPCWFHDTWHDARTDGRRHVGVDIFTVPGEYVYAVADGRLTGRAWDQPDRRSGNAWYLTSDAGDRFFYAHLLDFAPGLEVGSRVRAGQIIGWVGSTGNSTFPHLHFEVHPRGGEPQNPYPMLLQQGACNTGTPYTQPGGWVPD